MLHILPTRFWPHYITATANGASAGRWLSLIFLVVLWASSAAGETFYSYHIGNSLSVDSGVQWIGGGRGAPGYDAAISGYHIRCSQDLTHMIAHPDETCVDDDVYGTYMGALPQNAWNAITLQPYVGPNGGQELQSAATFVDIARQNPANGDTKIFILATWPEAPSVNGKPTIDFPAKWGANTYDYDRDTPMIHERGWYEWYVTELRSDIPDASIHMIPVGDVVLALDAKFRAGAYPGINDASDLYRDWRHFNNVGRYVGMMTTWATMHRTSPLTLEWDNGFFASTPGNHNNDMPRTEALSLLIRETVWEVLTEHQYAGVIEPGAIPGDFNGDGIVDAADFVVWRNSVGQEGEGLAADGIRNGVVDEWDYLLWRENYGRSLPPSGILAPTSVPEPGALALVGGVILAMAGWGRCRRRS